MLIVTCFSLLYLSGRTSNNNLESLIGNTFYKGEQIKLDDPDIVDEICKCLVQILNTQGYFTIHFFHFQCHTSNNDKNKVCLIIILLISSKNALRNLELIKDKFIILHWMHMK